MNENKDILSSQMLVDHFDRGGLFLMNDDFYGFVKRIEDVVKKVIDKKLINFIR